METVCMKKRKRESQWNEISIYYATNLANHSLLEMKIFFRLQTKDSTLFYYGVDRIFVHIFHLFFALFGAIVKRKRNKNKYLGSK